MKYLTIAIPCKASVQARFNMCLFHAVNQIHTLTGYKPVIRFLIGKSNIVHARSILLTEWYDKANEEDLFLFIDSDQTFAVEDIVNIIKHEGDVVSGIYVNGAGFPTCFPVNTKLFQEGLDNRLLYSGCGFMLIRRGILSKVIKTMEKDGPTRFAVARDSSSESAVVPFFQPKLLEQSEMSPNENPRGDWLGEDYSFCWRVRQAGGKVVAMFSHTLGHEIPQVSHLPEGYFPPSKRMQDDKDIVIYCGHSYVKFSPEMKSLGGSEKAVVQLSKEWKKKGYRVQVYGNVWSGNYDGVEYLDSREFDVDKHYNILILWRSLGVSILNLVKANHIWIDLHDFPNPDIYQLELLEKKKPIICVKSQFHRTLLSHVPDKFFFIQPNGVEIESIEKLKPVINKKEPMRCIWTSSYDRGLDKFLEYGWPLIRKHFPHATLHVFYGMDLCQEDFQKKMKELFEKMKSEGVKNYGKCDMESIIKEKWKSSYHIYISEFPEIDCLSIRESVLADCIPICASHAVFTERPCVRLGEELGEKVYTTPIWDQMLAVLQKLESEPIFKEKLIAHLNEDMKKTHLDISWEAVANKWMTSLI